MFIDDADIEKALHFIIEHAVEAAQARANRLHLEDYSRVIKSQIMCEYSTLPISAQERNAYADRQYIDHLDALKTAIFEDEKMRYLVDAARVKLDCWRTMQATERAMKL